MSNKGEKKNKLSRKEYEKELEKLQIELCRLQRWTKETGFRAVIIFEGRDAAGKGGVIKRITERVSPRVFRTVALPPPSDREKTQIYLQRYIAHLPAAGEIMLFDRSWYNRAGVERVMGFCSDEDVRRFLMNVSRFEHQLVDDGIFLLKYFFDVSQEVQEQRFVARATDPLKHWKLSPMDVKSWQHWWDYTAAYCDMIEHSDSDWAPWYCVPANDKRRARLNCIAHLLSKIPYEHIPFEPPDPGKRKKRGVGVPDEVPFRHVIPAVYK